MKSIVFDTDAIWEALGTLAIVISLFLTLFGSWVWAQERMNVSDAKQDERIARVEANQINTERRVTAIEDRLFSVLMVSMGGTLLGGTSTVFSIRTLRRLKNEGKAG